MPKLRLRYPLAVLLATSATALAAISASADSSDPGSNFFADPSCSTPTVCVQSVVGVLDQARARLGQPPYSLPGNFAQLSPAEQAFVLTNLDRVLYGLAPIPGLSSQLNQAAASAVRLDTDPVFSSADMTALTGDWGGGYRNLPQAYEAWMYDDGPGGPNLDCTAPGSSGCWDHRHNVLWRFTGGGPLAMGAAAGTDPHGMPSFALLIVQGDSAYRPDYVYTWSEALAAGAGGSGAISSVSRASAFGWMLAIVRLRVHRRTLFFHVRAPGGSQVACSLTRARVPARYVPCGRSVIYRRLRPALYRLTVRAGGRSASRTVRVR